MPTSYSILLDASFIEEKSEVVLTLFNGKNAEKKSFNFQPRLRVAYNFISKKHFTNLINHLPVKCKIKHSNDFTELVFEDIYNFYNSKNVFKRILEKQPVYLSPERQFLLLNELQPFSIIDKNLISLKDSKPALKEKYLEYAINEIFEKKEITKKDLSVMALSHFLFIPLEDVIPSEKFYSKEFLKNACFISGTLAGKQKKIDYNETNTLKGRFENASIISLNESLIKNKLIEKCTPELMNCKCCNPKSIYSKNLFENSIVKVKFLVNGFYHLTDNSKLAFSFHKSRLGKEQRQRMMKEFCLKLPPLGPFFENEIEHIPLFEAKKIEQKNECTIIDLSSPVWFCKKKHPSKNMYFPWILNELTKYQSKQSSFNNAKNNDKKTHIDTKIFDFKPKQNEIKLSRHDIFNQIAINAANSLLGSSSSSTTANNATVDASEDSNMGILKCFALDFPISKNYFTNRAIKQEIMPYFANKTNLGLNGLYAKIFNEFEENAKKHGISIINSKGLNFIVKGGLNSFFNEFKDNNSSPPRLIMSAKHLFL